MTRRPILVLENSGLAGAYRTIKVPDEEPTGYTSGIVLAGDGEKCK